MESFNSRFWDELLNRELFTGLEDARWVVLVQRELEFCQVSVISGAALAAFFYCVHADRGLIAAPWTPLAFPCVPLGAW